MAICWQRTIQAFFFSVLSHIFIIFESFLGVILYHFCYCQLVFSSLHFITIFYYPFRIWHLLCFFIVFFHIYIYILLLFIFRYNACFFKDSLYYIIYTRICICWFFIFIHFFAVCFSLFIICSFFSQWFILFTYFQRYYNYYYCSWHYHSCCCYYVCFCFLISADFP